MWLPLAEDEESMFHLNQSSRLITFNPSTLRGISLWVTCSGFSQLSRLFSRRERSVVWFSNAPLKDARVSDGRESSCRADVCHVIVRGLVSCVPVARLIKDISPGVM